MKHYILYKFAQYLNNFNKLNSIKRISNNTIVLDIESKIFYFDMSKGNSFVYMTNKKKYSRNLFNAPFDTILQKRFSNVRIIKVYLRNNDKILNILVENRSSYKQQASLLQFEFIGKNTNVIVLDKNDIILEALRHIVRSSSARIVRVGTKLQEIKKPNFEFEHKDIKNIEKLLLDNYEKKEKKELLFVKKQKLLQINKIIIKITKTLNSLEDIDTLKKKIIKLNKDAIYIVENLHKSKGYEKYDKLKLSNSMFQQSKKAKAKVKNQHIEYLNLSQKLDFYNKLTSVIDKCVSIDEIEFYFPKKDKNQIKTKKTNPYQSFFVNGYKIMLGRDERENIFLLKNSKASDFWFHLKGQSSSHVIVSNSKKEIPDYIIKEASKICVQFSTKNSGKYSVDYTQRRNVKVQSKANVLYSLYNTISINI
ncbi:Fibronectin/fibrinogen-binding protein [hydrothermal vent metagenome]|uniref:Fibronectin/fibrinogen-binding protein n=1 Tax=hydrothermal vent metagenome TaxID=652676 RepID=A0A3B1DSY7_9ZZZZ